MHIYIYISLSLSLSLSVHLCVYLCVCISGYICVCVWCVCVFCTMVQWYQIFHGNFGQLRQVLTLQIHPSAPPPFPQVLAEAKTTRKAIWTARLQHQLWPKAAAHPWFVRNLTVGVREYKSPTPVKLYIQLGRSLEALGNASVPAPLNFTFKWEDQQK